MGRPKGLKDRYKRKISPKSLANLKPFPPGVSGNPSGRPPGFGLSLTKLVAGIMENPASKAGRTIADAIATRIINECLAGNVRMIELVWDRLEPLIFGGGGSDAEANRAALLERIDGMAKRFASEMIRRDAKHGPIDVESVVIKPPPTNGSGGNGKQT